MNKRDLENLTLEELVALRDKLISTEPGFMDRAAASFDPTPEGQARILQARGIPASVQGDQVMYQSDVGMLPVDPDRLEMSDAADWAGELPSMGLSWLAAMMGGGLASPALATAGGMVGDVIRQNIAQSLGSGRDYDVVQTGKEGIYGVAGEGIGRAISGVLRGPLARSAEMPEAKALREKVFDFDTRYDTNIEGMAPIDSKTTSSVVAGTVQGLRQNPTTASTMRDLQDMPYFREISNAMDEIATREGLKQGTNRVETGALVRDAFESTLRTRYAQRKELYDRFAAEVDPTAVPELTNTAQAMKEIAGTNVFNRRQVGSQGLEQLRNAMDEATTIGSFKDLETSRQALFDELQLATRDPARMSSGVQSLMQKLHAALRADEDAFLDSGAGVGSEVAKQYGREAKRFAADMFTIDNSPAMQRIYRAMSSDRASDIPTMLKNMTPEEMKAIKIGVGMEGSEGGLKATSEGIKAWTALMSEVFADIRTAASRPGGGRRMGAPYPSDFEIISGQQGLNAMDAYKKGTLEELFGPTIEQAMREFFEITKQLSAAERGFGNFSGSSSSALAPGGLLDDVRTLVSKDYATGAGRLISRALADFSMTLGATNPTVKRYLLGQTIAQEMAPNLLRGLGRAAGQVGVRGGMSTLQSAQQDATRR